MKEYFKFIYDEDNVTITPDFLDNLEKLIAKADSVDKVREYINKHCVNEKVSKKVGYKCYTMADTQELEIIMQILGDSDVSMF